jgi:hypothetical protein
MPVSARGLEKLKTLRKLERLKLQGCKRVGDDAVAAVSSLAALRVLDLKGTSIKEKAVAQLRRDKPNCQILEGPWEGPNLNARTF